MQKITPFLWFNGNVEEAIHFYTSIFKNANIKEVRRYENPASGEKAKIFTAVFELEGQEFMALDGGSHFKFSPAISFFVKCREQSEVDEFWEKLSEGGRKDQCGWLTDKFGLSWQIIPDALGEMLGDTDPAKSKRVMDAMMKMTKIEISLLKAAYDAG